MNHENRVVDLQDKRGPDPKPDQAVELGPRGPGPKPGTKPQEERVFQPDETPPKPAEPQVLATEANPKLALAAAAHLKQRHIGLFGAMLLLVLLPIIGVAGYLWGVAEDQYASITGFTVRHEEGGSASSFLSGLAGFTGSGGSSDSDILYEFIQSQEIVERVDARLDLRGHYSQHWKTDKVFSLWPDADIEDLLWYWSRIVQISYDKSAGLMEIQVLAFDPDYARAVGQEIVAESQNMINTLSTAAREDAMRYAQADLDTALDRLKAAREALTAFRTRTRIVDPTADLQGRLGVMNNLQQQLAEALINHDLLLESSKAGDPRLEQASRRIAAIRVRISSEREDFARGGEDVGAVGDDYPSLISEFERLTVDRVYAEETYRAALAAVDVARAKAARLSRYLATYVEPTLAQSAEYPQRGVITGLALLFLLLAWSIVALVYYSIRDRR